MKSDEQNETENVGGRARVRWPPYTQRERELLERKFLGDWKNLDFMERFWEPVYDERDLLQWRRIAKAWRLRLSGRSYKEISRELGIDQRKECALVSGRNLRPYLASMYLNAEMLPTPRAGWKWILACTPKPTRPYPKAVAVPEKIQSFKDIVDFLAQFPPLPPDNTPLRFFGLSTEWFENNRTSVFGFLLGFLVGDGGKSYPECELRSRHYYKTAMTTNMAMSESNLRVLRYVQLGLDALGIESHQIQSNGILRWNSEASYVVTWILRACLGLKEGQRTSRNPVVMPWLASCPREFIAAFLQGLADSDGHVHKTRNYAEIASIPSSEFYQSLIEEIGQNSNAYPIAKPTTVRMNVNVAANIPLFNPVVRSYRLERLESKLQSESSSLPLFFQSLMLNSEGWMER
jgi:hypothetical protein